MLYGSTTSFSTSNIENAKKYLPLLKNAGMGAIDFGLDFLYNQNGGNTWKKVKCPIFDLPDEEFINFFGSIKKEVQKNGLVVGQTHAPFPTQLITKEFSKEVSEFNQYLFEVIIKSIKITSFMGSKYIVIHPIFGSYYAQMKKEEERKINIEFFTKLIPTLKEYGVVACLENMWVENKGKIYGAICSDFNEANSYIEELNAIAGKELFGFCLDVGHLTLTGTNAYNAIKTLGKNIKVLHLHDVDGIKDSHTLPFVGVGDWNIIMNTLKEIGYKGNINFEADKWCTAFPEELYPAAINMLGAVGKYFTEKYFNCVEKQNS